MSAPVCAICSEALPLSPLCLQHHPDHCHDCATRHLGGFDRREHLAPETPVVLSARDVQALVRYRIHRKAVLGTGPCTPVVREEED